MQLGHGYPQNLLVPFDGLPHGTSLLLSPVSYYCMHSRVILLCPLPPVLYTTLVISSIKTGKASRSVPGLCIKTKTVLGTQSCSSFTWRFRRFLLPPPSSNPSLLTRQKFLVSSTCQF